jgi:hypothetical protein
MVSKRSGERVRQPAEWDVRLKSFLPFPRTLEAVAGCQRRLVRKADRLVDKLDAVS